MLDISSHKSSLPVEVDSDELSVSWWVVVSEVYQLSVVSYLLSPSSCSISKCLDRRICLHDLILQRALRLLILVSRSDHCEVSNDLLRILRLSGSRLSGDKHWLVLLIRHHVAERLIGDGEQMRGHLGTTLVHVHLGDRVRVYWQHFVGVDEDAEETGVRLEGDFLGSTSLLNSHRSSSSSISVSDCAALRPRSRTSDCSCPRSSRTLPGWSPAPRPSSASSDCHPKASSVSGCRLLALRSPPPRSLLQHRAPMRASCCRNDAPLVPESEGCDREDRKSFRSWNLWVLSESLVNW